MSQIETSEPSKNEHLAKCLDEHSTLNDLEAVSLWKLLAKDKCILFCPICGYDFKEGINRNQEEVEMGKDRKIVRRIKLQAACVRHPALLRGNLMETEEKIIEAATSILNDLADMKENIRKSMTKTAVEV